MIPAAYRHAQLSKEGYPNVALNASLSSKLLGVDSGAPEIVGVSGKRLLYVSRGTAVILLVVYALYLVFELKNHAPLNEDDMASDKYFEEPGNTTEELEEAPEMNVPAAVSALLLVTIVTSFCADWLVASIEQTAKLYHIQEQFIGTILLPIVSNAADHATAVWMARKNKMKITIGICVGSSIQILAFVLPIMVIIGWITNHELTLFFEDFETLVLFVSVLFVQYLIQDGRSNYMEGVMLISLYVIIAMSFWTL